MALEWYSINLKRLFFHIIVYLIICKDLSVYSEEKLENKSETSVSALIYIVGVDITD